MEKLISLHRYWLQADVLKISFERAGARDFKLMEAARGEALAEIMFYLSPISVLMSYWYSSLFVVIEGYREVGLSDPEIDTLLTSPYLDGLRRYRNGVCHYQSDWFPKKMSELQEDEEHVDWVRLLHRRLGVFLLAQLKASFPKERREEIEAMIAAASQHSETETNQPPQYNAGGRPVSGDSPASATLSVRAPRG